MEQLVQDERAPGPSARLKMDARHIEDFALTFLDTLTKRPPPPVHVYAAFDETLALLNKLREAPLPSEVAACLGDLFIRLQPVDYGRALPRYLDYLQHHAASSPDEAAALAVQAVVLAGSHDPVPQEHLQRVRGLVDRAPARARHAAWQEQLNNVRVAA